MTTDVLFAAWNRLAMVRYSLGMLKRNTDWSRVRRLVIIDDGSTDGTREWLQQVTASLGISCAVSYDETDRLGGAPAIMNYYVAQYAAGADLVAKIDSDIAMPAGWLERSQAVMSMSPSLELLGLAAGWLGIDDGLLGYRRTLHIGGVGLMRLEAFRDREPLRASGVHGFTDWQERNKVRAGWIIPDVHATQLDLCPFEPWRTLAAEYVLHEWARPWPPYAEASHRFWDGWPAPGELWPA